MNLDYPNIDHPALSAFARIAEEYCAVVEAHETLDAQPFQQALHLLLPRLYATGLELPSTDILFKPDENGRDDDDGAEPADEQGADPDRLDQSEMRTLFDALTSKFGEHCLYRAVYDPYDPPEEPEVMHSLADDVTDIYRDLRCGLQKWRRGESGEALWEWRFGLENHWGTHATGAIRALHARAAWWEATWPVADERAT
jgi:hypothetical protein